MLSGPRRGWPEVEGWSVGVMAEGTVLQAPGAALPSVPGFVSHWRGRGKHPAGTLVAELQSGQREKWGILSAPSQLGWWLAGQEGGRGDRGRCQQDADGAGGGSGGLRVINGPSECPVPGQPPSAAALAASHALREALRCWLRLTTPGGGRQRSPCASTDSLSPCTCPGFRFLCRMMWVVDSPAVGCRGAFGAGARES